MQYTPINQEIEKIENFIPFIEKFSVKKVIFVSSTSVYADENEIVTEELVTEEIREKPVGLIVEDDPELRNFILSILKGNGNFTPRTRYVSVGSMSGDVIQLSASILRSVDLQLSGSGLGSWTKEEVKLLFSEILPEMFLLASQNKIKVNIEKVNLADIEKMWNTEVLDGKRLVVVI